MCADGRKYANEDRCYGGVISQGLQEGVEEAAKLGVSGLQAYMTPYGYMTAEDMSAARVRETLDIVSSTDWNFPPYAVISAWALTTKIIIGYM